MALELDSRYPGRFNPGDADYPQGSFKNRTAPGALDGSYLEKDWANDKEGFFQRLMLEAGIAANGSVDTALASQYYDALLQIIADNAADTLNAPIATVSAAGTIDLTTGAPDTSQLAISGTGVSINGFTVAENRVFLVKLNGVNTLVNSASLVTGTGANVTTAAGDTLWMRSTAANTVEVLGYVSADLIARRVTTSASDQTAGRLIKNGDLSVSSAWINFNGTGTIAIRSSFNVSGITDNGTGNYTVSLTNPMANSDYSVTANGNNENDTSAATNCNIDQFAVGSFRITTRGNASAQDQLHVSAHVFGEMA